MLRGASSWPTSTSRRQSTAGAPPDKLGHKLAQAPGQLDRPSQLAQAWPAPSPRGLRQSSPQAPGSPPEHPRQPRPTRRLGPRWSGRTVTTLIDMVPRQDGVARRAGCCPIVDHLARRRVRLAGDAVVARNEAAQIERSRRVAKRVAHLAPTALPQVEEDQGSLVARRPWVPPPHECLG